jgi:7-carboxy-7-deazaguanine synthase
MPYTVKEIFYTLQGEGANTGRAAVFCRFAGCNLWTGRDEDRDSAVCKFCDTDFRGTDGSDGGHFDSAEELASTITRMWSSGAGDLVTAGDKGDRAHVGGAGAASHAPPFVVCTGGEPLLQLDDALIAALHAREFTIAIETNGTLLPPAGLDWICVSPKAGAEQVLRAGHELKLVYPQPGAEPEQFEGQDFAHFFLQPMDGPSREANTRAAVQYCLEHPNWRLSLQAHKLLGIR